MAWSKKWSLHIKHCTMLYSRAVNPSRVAGQMILRIDEGYMATDLRVSIILF
jgi:hypothetical protein